MPWSVVVSLLACAPKVVPTEDAPEPSPVAEPASAWVFAPVGDIDAKATQPVSTSSVTLGEEQVPLSYQVLRRTDDDGFGRVPARDGTLLPACNEQDFNSILTVDGQPFLVSHFECTPDGMALSALDVDEAGAVSIRSSRPIDFAPVGGLWNPCSGMVTPWNTHLASEEYEPDARREPTPDQYWPHRAWTGMQAYGDAIDPYAYGWTPEVRILDADGTTEVVKHLSPGRASHEIAYVLPDRKTVYLSDDGSAVGWFLFVADTAGDLSAGHLYAARFEPTGDALGIGWVPLGHATDAQLRPHLERGLSFDELFRVEEPSDGACTDGFTFVRHAYGEECLALAEPTEAVPDPALLASRFEKRRYAGMLGASMELEKGEGVTFDPETGTVYVAVSKISGAMTDGEGQLDLTPNPCGIVYGGVVGAGVSDTEGKAIPSDHVMQALEPAVVGRPVDDGERCAPDGIANPDNVTFVPEHGALIIAEDTSKHEHAVLWAADVRRDGALQPLMKAPPYGEVTGVHWIPDVGGFSYLTVSVQHPWSEGTDELPEGITEADTRSFTGVLGPFPRAGSW